MKTKVLYLGFALVLCAAIALPETLQTASPFEISVYLRPPINEIIPASMVNDLPVYVFEATVRDANGNLVATARKILQPGAAKPVTSRTSPAGRIQAVITIDDSENASYTVEFVRNGKRLARSSSSIHLTPRPIGVR